jgi:hypothetical protein
VTPQVGDLSDEDLRALAEERLKDRSDFRWHLITYLVVNAMFWAIWAIGGGTGNPPWPVWITLFWGIALAFHWGYATRRPVSPQAIDAEMERMRGK